jgi:hypothetical protein
MYFRACVAGTGTIGNLIISYNNGQFIRNMDSKKRMARNTDWKKLVDLKICYSNCGVREPSEKE